MGVALVCVSSECSEQELAWCACGVIASVSVPACCASLPSSALRAPSAEWGENIPRYVHTVSQQCPNWAEYECEFLELELELELELGGYARLGTDVPLGLGACERRRKVGAIPKL